MTFIVEPVAWVHPLQGKNERFHSCVLGKKGSMSIVDLMVEKIPSIALVGVEA